VRVVITGASSGIGEALARHYAREGATLGLISRRKVDAEGLPEEVISYAVDVVDEAALTAAAQDFMRRFGAPDLVIANAGIGAGTEGAEIRHVAMLRKILETNVVGLAATLAAFAPAMRAAGERRGLPRPGRQWRLLRLEIGRDHLDGEPARGAARKRHFRRMRLPGIHRHADDARQPLPHAVPALGR
jgi:NAD(P)-dependent dehydrogenase (short-subunit alcohol dehydrogenase family)